MLGKIFNRGQFEIFVDVAQAVCPLVSFQAVWRLTDPDSFFDLS